MATLVSTSHFDSVMKAIFGPVLPEVEDRDNQTASSLFLPIVIYSSLADACNSSCAWLCKNRLNSTMTCQTLVSWTLTPLATAVMVFRSDRYRRWEYVYADSVPTAPYPRLDRAFFVSAESNFANITRNRGQTSSHIRRNMKLPTWVARDSINAAAALVTVEGNAQTKLV